jgi:membrane associated rhomboid family serine protease
MLIIPIGHESNTVRRLPWVTFGIMALCVGVHLLVSVQMASARRALEAKLTEFVTFCLEHPTLAPSRDVTVRLMGEANGDRFLAMLEQLRARTGTEETPASEEDQARYDQITLDLAHEAEQLPTRRLGYVPAEKNIPGLFSGMFVHSGWLHLLGNLLFLYLLGPFIEDVWGRPLFLAFYLVAGVFSSFMFGLHYPRLTVPLIGASGAIAGVMGAFLVRYWKTKIEFFYFIFFFVRGTFQAPAFIMLPLWFVLELFNAKVMDSLNPGGGGGVAHWAHVWGFGFGVGVALVLMKLQVEKKYISPKIEAQVQTTDSITAALDGVLNLKMRRRFDEAFGQALELSRRSPTRDDVARILWSLAVESGRQPEAARAAALLVEREVRRDQLDAAVDDFRSLRRDVPDAAVSPAAKLALARHLARSEAGNEAREILAEALARLDGNSPPGTLLEAVKLSASLGSAGLARKAIELCLLSPEVPAEQKARLVQVRDQLASRGH